MKTIFFLIFILPCVVFAQVITDTLWSIPALDGMIAYRPGSGIFNLVNYVSSFDVGDGFDYFLQEEVFDRSYISYDLSSLPIDNSLAILSARVYIYQAMAIGNDNSNIYPIWNVAGGDTHFCVLDHIDYGYSLDISDWTAGDPGDPQTLHTNIGILSDNATIEFKTIDVTTYVREDLQNKRTLNQYRIRFTIDRDFDCLGDCLLMRAGNCINNKPYLIIEYQLINGIETQDNVTSNFILHQNFPNPFNSHTNIKYSLEKSGEVVLEIIDSSGRFIKTLINEKQTPGVYSIKFNAESLPSGVYFYRLRFGKTGLIKKMILLR